MWGIADMGNSDGVTLFPDTGKVKNITVEWLYWDSRG